MFDIRRQSNGNGIDAKVCNQSVLGIFTVTAGFDGLSLLSIILL